MAAIPDNIRTELRDQYDFERELVGGGFDALARRVGLALTQTWENGSSGWNG